MKKLLPEFFRREDEWPDALFYARPRFVAHLDEAASRAAFRLYDELLPEGDHILDLMAGYLSHLPDKFARVTGLGLNRKELSHNPSLSDFVILDLNQPVFLPFASESLGGAVCTVSVQYMTRPLETFAEVARSLRPGAPFIVTFSNRFFPTKAVLAWRATDDAAHVRLVRSYFQSTPLFGPTFSQHFEPETGDPLFSVWAYRL
jgi:SAM-dependent methyltransferase